MVCIFGCGDCGSSASASVKITNTTNNQNLTNILNTSSSSVATNTFTSQTITLLPCTQDPNAFRAECGTGGLNISQITVANIKICTDISDSQAQDIRNVLSAAIAANAEAESKAETQFFSTASSSAVSATDISNHISNLISTNITNQNIKNIINSTRLDQVQTIYQCGTWTGNSCNLTQNIQLSLISDSVLSQMNSIVKNDTFLADIKVEAKAGSDSFAGGLTGMIEAVGKIFGSIIMGYVIVIGLIILAVGGFFYLVVKLLTGGGAATAAAAAPNPGGGGSLVSQPYTPKH